MTRVFQKISKAGVTLIMDIIEGDNSKKPKKTTKVHMYTQTQLLAVVVVDKVYLHSGISN